MPTMWRAMTNADRSAWPWSRMWSGVIVMTATIVVCEMTTATRPRRAPGKRRITANAPRTCAIRRTRGSLAGARPPATTSGSGRMKTATTRAARTK